MRACPLEYPVTTLRESRKLKGRRIAASGADYPAAVATLIKATQLSWVVFFRLLASL